MAVTDLAARWLGGTVLAASDESFGDKENLLNPGPATRPGTFGNRGEVVDGWETRRLREPGNDWAVVRLGAAGTIASIHVDTAFFGGNFPASCRVEACGCEGYPGAKELESSSEWTEIVPRSPLQGDYDNVFAVSDLHRFTHVRLSIFPDGGVARLRVLGEVIPDPREFDGVTVDLVSQSIGGALVDSSDSFYTSASMLNRPDEPRTMGDGWETRRRRDHDNDFAIFKLGIEGEIRKVAIDTTYFRYNATPEILLQCCDQLDFTSPDAAQWQPLLGRTSLQPDTSHVFMLPRHGATAYVRLDAFPDGGLARLRLIGHVDPLARRQAGYHWFNSLPARQARSCLEAVSLSGEAAAQIIERRPLAEGWTDSQRESPQDQSDVLSATWLQALRTMLDGTAIHMG